MTAVPTLLDESGRVTQIGDDYEGTLYDANGNPVYGQHRLTYGEWGFVTGDPGGTLATPWSAAKDQGSGNGILFDLDVAAAGTADFTGNFAYIAAPLKDLGGRAVGSDLAAMVWLSLKMRGAAPIATDICAAIAMLANTGDPTTAVIDGMGPGMLYDAGGVNRIVRASALNGAGSINTGVATLGVGMSAGVIRLSKQDASTAGFAISRPYPVDANGDALTTNVAGAEVASAGVFPYWVYLFFGHQAAGPAIDASLDLYYTIPLNSPHAV